VLSVPSAPSLELAELTGFAWQCTGCRKVKGKCIGAGPDGNPSCDRCRMNGSEVSLR